jgi:hypothetical protein
VVTVEEGPWARVSWTTGTEFEPLFCLRVVGLDEDGGNIRSSFDYNS